MPARYRQIVDLLWADDGDLVIQPNIRPDVLGVQTGGDFADTKRMEYRGWLQRVKARLESSRGDWKYADIGASMAQFSAASNTPETADALKSRIYNELSQDDLVRPTEMRVEVFPLSESHLGVIVAVQPPGENQEVVLTYSVGLRDNNSQVKREA